MKIQPFQKRHNWEGNKVFEFRVLGDSNREYLIDIEMDEETSLIKDTKCECPHFQFRHEECKHIKLCMETLKNFGIKYKIGFEDESK